jgi:hypothetical protein
LPAEQGGRKQGLGDSHLGEHVERVALIPGGVSLRPTSVSKLAFASRANVERVVEHHAFRLFMIRMIRMLIF